MKSVARTSAALASSVAFVYVLYLSQVVPTIAGLSKPASILLAAACLLSAVTALSQERTLRAHLRAYSGVHRWVGWLIFSAGIVAYALATISVFPAYMHWISLWVILPGLAIAFLGLQDAVFVTPGLAFLFLIVPPLPSNVAAYGGELVLLLSIAAILPVVSTALFPPWAKLLMCAPFALQAVISTVPAYAPFSVLALTAALAGGSLLLYGRYRLGPEVGCDLDSSPINLGRRGCVSCGRPLEDEGRTSAGAEVAVLSVLLALALIVSLVSIPMISVGSNDVDITTVGATHSSTSPFIAAPSGFLQNSSSSSPSLEKFYGEQLVVTKQLFPVVRPENLSYSVYLEVSSSHTFLVKHWQFLGGYNRTTETLSTNGSSPITVYSTLLKGNRSSMIAVSYELPLTARYNGTFQQLYLGVSVLAHPAFNVTERAYAEMKRQMIADFVAPEAKLVVASAWTSEISSTVSTLGAMGPYAGAGAGATVVLGLLGVALKADAQDQVLLDSVDGLDREDQIILARAVALRLKKYPQEGAVFFRSTRSHLSGDNTAQAFFSRLLNLERMGYLRQVPHLAGGHVRYYWQSISL